MTHDHPPADPFRLLHVSSAVAVGETGAVCVALWRGAVTRSPFELQRSGLADVVRRHPAGVGFLCVVEKSSVPPDDELRRASMRMLESHGECIKCVATVVEADGFAGSVARGVLTGMHLLATRKFAFNVSRTVGESARWMARHVDVPSPEGLTAAVEAIRGTFPAQ